MASAAAASLKEYLKRYESGPATDEKRKKKKKKSTDPKAPPFAGGGGVLIVDEDPTWQKPIAPEEDGEPDGADSAGEDNPVVDEDIEVKRLKRLEAIRARKPYLSVSEDGSGWVSVSDPRGGGFVGNREPFPKGDGGDLSPPRQTSRRRFHTPSPEREGAARNEKLSTEDGDRPKGVRRNSHEVDISPPRRGRDADLSPPRRVWRGTPEEDISPPRRARRSSAEIEMDLSPRRRGRRDSAGSDLSPPRRARRDSPDSNLSPVRRGRRSSTGSDLSPPRRARRDSPDSDLSPVRHAQRSSPMADLSPPRRARRSSPGSDISPPRCVRKGSADSDLSPPRRRRDGSPAVDLSPPRKSRKMSVDDGQKHGRSGFRSREPAGEDMSPPRRREKKAVKLDTFEHLPERVGGSKPMLDEGKRKGGLYTGSEIREEVNRKKAEILSRFESLDPAKSGKGAEPVYRNQGMRISKEEKLKLEKKADEKPKEKKLEWGKGLAQKREAEAQALELELEKGRPFARTRDDLELDKMLKDRIRWGDPMAHLVKKKDLEIHLKDFGDDEKMQESGFVVPQTIPSHSWIKRGIDPLPNRYGIKPGRHWDGVDRSTGYEKELFKRQNEKRATQTEAYLWSVADM